MKILFVHNYYQISGGEDKVFESESSLMEENGHDVDRLIVHNDSIKDIFSKARTFFSLTNSRYGRRLILQHIKDFKPEIVHVHNFFPLLSPSIFYACNEVKTPVVYTLHNYRILCPSSILMLNGKIYEKSLHGSAYWAVPKKAYKNSYLGTFILARMIEYHKRVGTWRDKVDHFIALTNFAKLKFIEAKIPKDKITVKPNYITEPCNIDKKQTRDGALFVGRISEEKGIETLIKAWSNINLQLTIVGDGPYLSKIKNYPNTISFVGPKKNIEINKLMSISKFLIIPSEWYEGFPMVLLEAFANRLPVIASNIGSLMELVANGISGLHFKPGNVEDLREKINWMIQNNDSCRLMGENARSIYEQNYTPNINYKQLIQIYKKTIYVNKNL